MPFDINNTVHPFLCYKYPYTVRSLLTSRLEQLISLAFSSIELATTTFPLCFLNAFHVSLSIQQCLDYFAYSTCQTLVSFQKQTCERSKKVAGRLQYIECSQCTCSPMPSFAGTCYKAYMHAQLLLLWIRDEDFAYLIHKMASEQLTLGIGQSDNWKTGEIEENKDVSGQSQLAHQFATIMQHILCQYN